MNPIILSLLALGIGTPVIALFPHHYAGLFAQVWILFWTIIFGHAVAPKPKHSLAPPSYGVTGRIETNNG